VSAGDDIRRRVAAGPLTAFQLGALAVCIGLNMLDGFDILAMSFSASGVKADWNLTHTELGRLLSAGLVGMAFGSLLFAPSADYWGRRRIILLTGAIAGAGMLGSVAARAYSELLVLRFLTGIGIGGTIASVAVVVSEYVPDRWRSSALAAYATGYPVGASVGGALSTLAIPRYGWRSAFAIGGTMSLLLLALAWRRLPESLDFLLVRRPPGALGRVNALLGRMHVPALSALPEPQALAPVLAGLLGDVIAVENNDSSSSWTPLGFFDPLVYQFASYFATHPGAPRDPFSDVENGSNYVFSAGPGWDATTGWGGVTAPLLLAALGNRTLLDYNYSGPTPILPVTPGSTSGNIPWTVIFAIFGVGIVVAILLVVLASRPSRSQGNAPSPGVPWGAQAHTGPLPPAPPGTYPGATYLCPYCGAIRPSEPVRCPQCGAL